MTVSLSYIPRKFLKHFLKFVHNLQSNKQYFMEYSKKGTVPEVLFLEFVNICNANCIFCAYQYDKRKKQFMSDTVFHKVLDEYWEMGGRRVGLTPHFGEAFVDRHIIERIQYIKLMGFESIHVYSNASLFDKFGFENILCSGLTQLNISTAPLEEDIYKKIFRSNNYKKVLDNIHQILATFKRLKEEMNRRLTVQQISIEFRSDRSVEDCQKCKDYVEYVQPFLNSDVHVGGFTTFDSWSGVIKQSDLLPGMKIKNSTFPKRFPCGRTNMVQIETTGNARICGCRSDTTATEDELYIGDTKTTSLSDLYNSKKVADIKKSFYNNRMLKICEKCSWYEM